VSDTLSISSEDSLPDLSRLASSSSTRIIHRPSSSTDAQADPFSDPEFIKLNMTMPGEPASRIRAAWKQSGYNFQRATALMANPSWSPSTSSPEKLEKEDVGRVKEVEAAFRAQRIAVKEKGKKSMIYANRLALETKSQSTPKNDGIQVVDMTQTPNTPVFAPRRKRLKKLVIDSESEAEVEDDDESEDGKKQERIESNDETRALNYLNTTSREGIQELTGMFLSIGLLPRSNLPPSPPRRLHIPASGHGDRPATI
jgi:SWI/SNF-related matrix-associated actin-dependent regulator 1 of chromatin subfamily A